MDSGYGAANAGSTDAMIHRTPSQQENETKTRTMWTKGWALAAVGASFFAGSMLVAYQTITSQSNVAVRDGSMSSFAKDLDPIAPIIMESAQQSVYDAVLRGARFIMRVRGKNNLCVDDGNGATAGSSKFTLWTCDTSNQNQIFVYDAVAHRIRNPIKNLCVDDAGGEPGKSNFLLWYCDSGNKNQDFVYDPSTQMFRNPSQLNICMDDGGGTTQGQTRLTPWFCDPNNQNQHFEFVLVAPLVYDVPSILLPGAEILLQIRGKDDLCMDDGGATTSGGAKFSAQPCNPLNPNQLFVYDSNTYQLRSARKPNNLCMDDGGSPNAESKVQLWECNPDNINQRFVFEESTSMFRNPLKKGLCLDDGGGTTPGQTQFLLWNCDNNNPNQHFVVFSQKKLAAQKQSVLNAVADGARFIMRVPGKNNLCLDDGNGATAASSQFLLWNCNPENMNQVFYFDAATKRIRSYKKSGLCIDDGGGQSAGGSKFVLWYCDANNKNQDLEYDPTTMLVRNPNKNLCMDDGGSSKPGDTKVLLWNCDVYNKNQHFEIVLVDSVAPIPTPSDESAEATSMPPLFGDEEASIPPLFGDEDAETTSMPPLFDDEGAGPVTTSSVSIPSPLTDEIYTNAEGNNSVVLTEIPTLSVNESIPATWEEYAEINASYTQKPRDEFIPLEVDDKPQRDPENPFDPAAPNPSFETTIFNFSEGTYGSSGDWNLLAPSHDTIALVNADNSVAISSDEIFQYLSNIKDAAELEYVKTMYKYERTFRCASAGLKTLAKERVTVDEYHVLVAWMYEHCVMGNSNVEPTPNLPLTLSNATSTPDLAPLVKDSPNNIDRTYMTKLEFYYEIKKHFEGDREEMFGQETAAHLRAELASAREQKLLQCIREAAEVFGYHGASSRMDNFDIATRWIHEQCMTV